MLAGCDIPIFTKGVSRDGVHVMYACMFLLIFLFVCFVVVVVVLLLLLFQHNYSLIVYGVVLNSKTSLILSFFLMILVRSNFDHYTTLCTLSNCSCFCCRLLTFFKIVFWFRSKLFAIISRRQKSLLTLK